MNLRTDPHGPGGTDPPGPGTTSVMISLLAISESGMNQGALMRFQTVNIFISTRLREPDGLIHT